MITQELRLTIERRLGQALPDAVWEYLLSKSAADTASAAEGEIGELVSEARRLLGAFGQHSVGEAPTAPFVQKGPTGRGSKGIEPRAEAVSILLAEEAQQDEQVTEFRQDHLDGRVVGIEEVGRWVSDRARDDGPPSQWIELPLPKDHEVSVTARGLEVRPPIKLGENPCSGQVTTRQLWYVAYIDREWHTRFLPTATGGVLEILRQLSVSLTRKYGWNEAQATSFVLTGEVPMVSLMRSSVTVNHTVPAGSRINLDVDPTLSPREVSEAFAEVRKRFFPGRHRSMGDKHTILAVFSSSRQEKRLAEQMTEWNTIYPDWSYNAVSNFGRDALNARRRLMRPFDVAIPERK